MSKYKCQFCNKEFARERTLGSHACEKRRRFNNKDKKSSKIAFTAFNKFYQGITRSTKSKTVDEFINSQYYLAFTRFGEYCTNTKVINVNKFILFLIKNEIHIDKWNKDSTYDLYLEHLLLSEDVADAMERTIEYSISWGTDKNMNPWDLFRFGTTYRIQQAISQGKISPWVLLKSTSGFNWVQQQDDEILSPIWHFIDVNKWSTKFNNNKDDATFAEEVLKHGGW